MAEPIPPKLDRTSIEALAAALVAPADTHIDHHKACSALLAFLAQAEAARAFVAAQEALHVSHGWGADGFEASAKRRDEAYRALQSALVPPQDPAEEVPHGER